jgi:hypothetical protein
MLSADLDHGAVNPNYGSGSGRQFTNGYHWLQTVLQIRIRIHRIHVFLGLDPSVRGMDPESDPAQDPDPSVIKQN